MNLLQIRRKFVEISGRYDLIVDTTDWADNGADFFINAGQRFLDRLEDLPKMLGRVFRMASNGDYGITFQECRSIKEVWVADTTDRWELEKVSMRKFRRDCFNEPISSIQTGEPYVYTPAMLRIVPDRITADNLELIVGYADVMLGDNATYRGIVWMPPADGDYQVEVVGHFYSPELESDLHTSFWSEVHPMALIQGAMAMLEMSYRNTQGFNDAVRAINALVTSVGFDAVEEEISSVVRMEG